MQLKQQIPAIWVYTTADAFNALPLGDGPSFLTAADRARLERIRQARLLYQGLHRRYFLEEGRTQFDFPRIRAGDREMQQYVTYNLLKLISKKSADLLFGQEPLVRVDDEIQQGSLSALVERTNLHQRLYNAAVDCSYEAECFLESCIRHGEVYLRVLDAMEVFPLGAIGADGQYERYVRRQLERVGGTDQAPINGLLETTYFAGSIERRVFQLGDKGEKVKELKLENWPTPPIGEDFSPRTATGLKLNTITWIPNELDHGQPVSDYDGQHELQDELNAKQTQIARVLAKHSDPKMAFPEAAFDERGGIQASADAFPFRDADQVPRYITWNGELANAMADRDFTVAALLIASETSPVLLGIEKGAAPESFRKLRLTATNSLSKAARKATNWKPGIRRAIAVCQAMENTIPGLLSYQQYPLAVEMRDGIPVDELDQANTIATLRAAGVLSVERGLTMQLGDSAAVDKELAELKKEKAENMPTVLAPLGGSAGEAGADVPAEQQAEGVAA